MGSYRRRSLPPYQGMGKCSTIDRDWPAIPGSDLINLVMNFYELMPAIRWSLESPLLSFGLYVSLS